MKADGLNFRAQIQGAVPPMPMVTPKRVPSMPKVQSRVPKVGMGVAGAVRGAAMGGVLGKQPDTNKLRIALMKKLQGTLENF
jgi:uncharacterized protein YcfJ